MATELHEKIRKDISDLSSIVDHTLTDLLKEVCGTFIKISYILELKVNLISMYFQKILSCNHCYSINTIFKIT